MIDAAIFMCSLTGNMAKPWAEAGYECFCVDTQHSIRADRIDEVHNPKTICKTTGGRHEWRAMDWEEAYPASSGRVCIRCDTCRLGWLGGSSEETTGKIHYVWGDVRSYTLPAGYRPIFGAAFTPCTHVAGSGARDFAKKRGYLLRDALEMFEAARQCFEWARIPYMLENSVGCLSSVPHIGKPDHYFHPSDYTAFELGDHYSKKTCIWSGGGFVMPPKAIDTTLAGIKPDNRIHFASPGTERANFRSETPMGFARAVFQANRPDRQSIAA